jgi:hypothetical protein
LRRPEGRIRLSEDDGPAATEFLGDDDDDDDENGVGVGGTVTGTVPPDRVGGGHSG